jgi:hypothetical protein
MTSFDEYVDQAKRATRAVGEGFTKADDDWAPVALVYAEEKLLITYLALEKHEMLPALRSVVRQEKAHFVAMVMSTWHVQIEKRQGAREEYAAWRATHPNLSEHPDATELLLLDCGSPTRAEIWSADINRFPDRPPVLGEWKLFPEGTTGPMAHIAQRAFATSGNA